MDVRLDAESSELVEHYLRKGGYDTPADLIHAALTYFAMRPEDWKRIGQQAEVGLKQLEEGNYLEFESDEALMEYIERRVESRRRDASRAGIASPRK
jgi:hypothetical protein